MSVVPISEFHARFSRGDVRCLIDVRTPAEFREVHVKGASNVPLGELTTERVKEIAGASEAVYFICKGGGRSGKACELIAPQLSIPVFSVDGGTASAEAQGIPVERGGKSCMSIERQVRVGAGTLVLLGVVAGVFLHPWAIAVSAFVGAGLIVAGVTNWCGMALVLEKMPWNR